jgi:site-specific recombinase XerD
MTNTNTTKTQKEYISQYEQYLIVDQAKSNNTVVNYISDLKQYFSKYDVIDRESIQRYKKDISELSSTTVNRKLSSLKSFNEYLLGLGVVDSLVIIKADFSKTQDIGNPTDVTEKQVAMFLNRVNTKETMYKSRNIALINLIANTGIRREEATNIKLKDIDFDNYELTIASGKGKKQDMYY